MKDYIILHHTAFSRQKNPDQFNQTNEYHRQKWNFPSRRGFYGGYNYEISASGKVRQFRDEDEETIGATGYNHNAIHICLDGNFDQEYPTWEQRTALKNLLADVLSRHPVRWENIIPHRKVANKSCYGTNLGDSYGRDLAVEFYTEKISFLRQLVIHLKDLLARKKLGKMDDGCL